MSQSLRVRFFQNLRAVTGGSQTPLKALCRFPASDRAYPLSKILRRFPGKSRVYPLVKGSSPNSGEPQGLPPCQRGPTRRSRAGGFSTAALAVRHGRLIDAWDALWCLPACKAAPLPGIQGEHLRRQADRALACWPKSPRSACQACCQCRPRKLTKNL